MVEVALEICCRAIAHLIFWLIIVILITPAVLFVAAWQRGSYWQNVRANYVQFFGFAIPRRFSNRLNGWDLGPGRRVRRSVAALHRRS